MMLLFVASPAFALTLEEAKDKNLVGEQTDGYLGSPKVNPSDKVEALIADINSKRKAKYQEIAKGNGTKLSAVEKLAAKKAIDLTKKGHSYSDTSGAWKIK